MPRIKNRSVPTGELVRELAGKSLSSANNAGANYVVSRYLQLPIATGTSSGIVMAVQNPESYPLIVRSVTLVVDVAAQTSASFDIGIVASSGASASDIFGGAAASPPGTVGTFPLPVGRTFNGGSGSSGSFLTAGGISKWEKNGFSSDAWMTAKLTLGTGSSLAGYLLVEVIPYFST